MAHVIQRRKVFADGSLRLRVVNGTVQAVAFLAPAVAMFVTIFAEKVLGLSPSASFALMLVALAGMAVFQLRPPSRTFFFDMAKQELRVSHMYGGPKRDWSQPYSAIERVWRVHETPKASENALLLVSANQQTYALFNLQGFWRISNMLEDIRRAMRGTNAAIDPTAIRPVVVPAN